MICDGGYCKWKCLIPPYKHQIPGTQWADWSKHVESVRKDVECSFGILKKRFAILKHRMRFHHKEQIGRIFTACCILHNMLHDWDGYDNWESVETNLRALEEMFDASDRWMFMRDHSYYGTNEVDDDIQDGFFARRSALIAHYMYLKSRQYNVNRL